MANNPTAGHATQFASYQRSEPREPSEGCGKHWWSADAFAGADWLLDTPSRSQPLVTIRGASSPTNAKQAMASTKVRAHTQGKLLRSMRRTKFAGVKLARLNFVPLRFTYALGTTDSKHSTSSTIDAWAVVPLTDEDPKHGRTNPRRCQREAAPQGRWQHEPTPHIGSIARGLQGW